MLLLCLVLYHPQSLALAFLLSGLESLTLGVSILLTCFSIFLIFPLFIIFVLSFSLTSNILNFVPIFSLNFTFSSCEVLYLFAILVFINCDLLTVLQFSCLIIETSTFHTLFIFLGDALPNFFSFIIDFLYLCSCSLL